MKLSAVLLKDKHYAYHSFKKGDNVLVTPEGKGKYSFKHPDVSTSAFGIQREDFEYSTLATKHSEELAKRYPDSDPSGYTLAARTWAAEYAKYSIIFVDFSEITLVLTEGQHNGLFRSKLRPILKHSMLVDYQDKKL